MRSIDWVWVVFVVVFCGVLGSALEDKEVIKGVLTGFGLVSDAQLSDDALVEVLENHCRVELFHLKRIYDDLGFSAPEALSILDPQIKHNLYKCFTENYVLSLVPGEEVSHVSWLQKHLGSVSFTSSSTANLRRQLAEAPSPAQAPSSSSPEPSASNQPGAKQQAPPPVGTFFIPPFLDKDAANSRSDTSRDHNSDNRKTIIIAVVVTAVATFLAALILFICCRKAFGGGSRLDHKDDRPLLRLSGMSEYSVSDSPSKTWAFENSSGKVNGNGQSNPSNFTNTIGVVSSAGKVSANSSVMQSSTDSFSSESAAASASALKSSLGSNEPPASMRPTSSMGGPPPPPPPKPPSAPPPPKPPSAPPPPPMKAGPPPPPPPGGKPGPRPPPPLKGGRPPPVSVKAGSSSADANGAKTKLKPFFWDKVMANPDHSMVWDQIKSGSFQFNEEMIESLFGYTAGENKNDKKKDSSSHDPHTVPQFIQLIDQKKAQNLAILLRAMNVTTEEVCEALQEGIELPPELLETLLKMAPTSDEELKLRLFSGDISLLGSAERFLKVVVNIPFAFKRMEILFLMGTLQEEATIVKDNFATLEAACKELRNSRLFLKLLEAVLKTGNRMNDGTYRGGAQAFKLDTLLKLADVKGTDGKTTLLHFVVQEIIRSEGLRAARSAQESRSMSSIKSEDLLEDVPDDSEDHYRSLGLEVVSGVGDQLQNVRKAACLDSDIVTGTIAKLGSGLHKAKIFLNKEFDEVNEESGFHKALKSFVQHAEADVMLLLDEEKRIMSLVKSTVDYFHGNSGKEEGLRLFVIVRDFLIMLDKVCREVKAKPKWPSKTQKKEPPTRQTSAETPRTPFSPDFRERLFPAIAERRMNGSSSDDD